MNRNKSRLLSVIFVCFLGIFAITGNAMAATCSFTTSGSCSGSDYTTTTAMGCSTYQTGCFGTNKVRKCTQYYSSYSAATLYMYLPGCDNAFENNYGVLGGCTSDSNCSAPTSHTFTLPNTAKVTATGMATCSSGKCTHSYVYRCGSDSYSDSGWSSITTNPDTMRCQACPSYSTSVAGSTSVSACKCRAGYAGAITSSSSTCTACGPGKYSATVGTTSCSSCSKGTYSNGSVNTSCTSCAAGKYQDTTGQSSCKDCGTGHKCPTTGMQTYEVCPAGTYQSSTTGTSCIDCTAGTYQANTGQASCSNCAKGTYQPNTGQTSCSNCGPGYACPNTGMTTRNNCGNGYYSSGTKNQSCSTCGAGYMCPGTNVTSRTPCPAGQYQSSSTATSCLSCTGNTYTPHTGMYTCVTVPYNATVNSAHTDISCYGGYYKTTNRYSGEPWYFCTPCPSNSGGTSPWDVAETTLNGTSITSNAGSTSITDCKAYKTASDTKGTYTTPYCPYTGDDYVTITLYMDCLDSRINAAGGISYVFPTLYQWCAMGYFPWSGFTDNPDTCVYTLLGYQWFISNSNAEYSIYVPMGIAQTIYRDLYYSDSTSCFYYG